MRIREIKLSRAQRAWVCEVVFTARTARQFTDEEMTVRSGGRSLLTSLWNGIKSAKRKAADEQAAPDELKRNGWSA